MEASPETESGWRGSRDLWLGAAYAALIDQGVEAVKIQTLGARLNLSRTSFYWFFRDRSELLAALLDTWAGRTTGPLLAATRAYAQTGTEAMLNVMACFLADGAFDARLEFAVRGWALRDPAVLTRVRSADVERLDALRAMLERWGHAGPDADVRARTVYLTQIGYISMQSVETLETRLSRIPQYVQVFTGTRPSDSEMARFRAAVLPPPS